MGICFSFRTTPQLKESDTVTMNNETHSENTESDESKNFLFNLYPSLTRSLMLIFGNTGNTAARTFQIRVQKLFDVYKDPYEDVISIDGVEQLCDDLEIPPEDFRILVLAWKCNAHQMCRLKRMEFTQGCHDLNVDSIELMQTKLSEVASDLHYKNKEFRSLYRFTFKFGLDNDNGERILPINTAYLLWQLVFEGSEPVILQSWLTFLKNKKLVNGISKDTWNMFLCFVESVSNGDLTNYDETDAWPSIIDDFIEYQNHQTKKTE